MHLDPKKIATLQSGLRDFKPWLLDALREGVASLEAQPPEFWQTAAARLTDVGARGAANWLKEIPAQHLQQPDWAAQTMRIFGDIYLLVQGFERFETLPEALQDELLIAAGVTIQAKTLLLQDGILDTWQVLGQHFSRTIDGLFARRTWLYGAANGIFCLLQDYAFEGFAAFTTHWNVGTELRAEVVYYPGNAGLRGIVKPQDAPQLAYITACTSTESIVYFHYEYAKISADAPFLSLYPCLLAAVTPTYRKTDNTFYLIDNEGFSLPILCKTAIKWKLLALSGNAPITVFGEYTGAAVAPLSVLVGERLVVL